MVQEIKKIKTVSLAKTIAVFYGLIGFFTAVFTLIFFLGGAVMEEGKRSGLVGLVLFNIVIALFSGFVVSVITSVFGWIIGFLTAFFYNMFAFRLGGVKVELADAVEPAAVVKEENKKDNQNF